MDSENVTFHHYLMAAVVVKKPKRQAEILFCTARLVYSV